MSNTENIYNRCLKCGFCVNVCPVYKEIKEEIVSPRAKLRLVKAFKEGSIIKDKYLRKISANCLMCETCFKNCPSGLRTSEVILELRERFKEKYGLDWKKRILNFILSNNNLRSMSAIWARVVYNNFVNYVPANISIGALNLKYLPKINPALKRIKSDSTNVKKVLYYVGCLDRFLFSNTATSTIKILNKLGYSVEVSDEERCCGMPIIISGDVKSVLSNIKKNVDLLANSYYDYIITTCPTCAVALKEKYPEILQEHNKEYLKKINSVKDKIIDINKFIFNKKELPELLKECKEVVTYHDPCHLVNTLGIYNEPRAIISMIPGIKYIEMRDASSCCGSGGFYHIYFPEVSKKIGERKLENIKKTGANLVLTSCPACKLQLINLLNSAKMKIKVLHIVELLGSGFE
ncbi:MAG: (Fe-S)-binding protein [Candidatus Firestonebacteria bacterium]